MDKNIPAKKRNIQLLVSNEEYEWIKEKADKKNMTVSLYARELLLEGSNNLAVYYNELLEKVDELNTGIEFTIKELFGVNWRMDRGVKLRLGRMFNEQVQNGVIKNVKLIRQDSSNTKHYKKI
ncbi:MAG: DUF1413 domain-containing protein [Eubacterium sp.]|nr:DUF1413 domain-containing protein [Eubacterium sp.]